MKEILVVVDMQVDFVTGALGSKEAAAIVPNVVAKIKEYQGRENAEILVTLDTHEDNYMDTREGRFLPVPHCIKGTKGWELIPEIKELLKEKKQFEKPTFGSRQLAEYLTALEETEKIKVEFIGVCTDICVVSNALLVKAALPETDILVDGACCAGVTPAAHDAALITMKSCQVEVLG